MRGGQDVRLKKEKRGGKWRETHTLLTVSLEMYFQIQLDYRSLPNPPDLTLFEIRLYYNYLRGTLKEATKKRD